MSSLVEEYYTDKYREELRHNDPFGVIQELRTKEIISRYLKKGIKILDIGGANGIYSFYFSSKGYDVTLMDITPRHIELAREKNSKVDGKLANIILGDALTYKSKKKYDLIILHGPLYHITDRGRRIKMLNNISNLLSSKGKILGFAINRYAGYFYGVRTGEILNSEYREKVISEAKSGFRDSGPGWHFHKPEELIKEFQEASYTVTSVKSVAGQLWMIPDIDKLISDSSKLKEVLEITAKMEDHVDIGQDLVCIAEK